MRPCILSIVCYLFSCQMLSLGLTPFLRSFLCVNQKVDHRGIRTPSLLIRSQTPYPLGHAAMCSVSCICCLFSCQVLFLVMTRFLRTFLCVKQKVDHRGIRTTNLLIPSQTLYPLSHAAMCTVNCMLLIQLPSVVPCVDSISKKFPLCQAKSRPQRDSNPESSDSKSDALSVVPCGHVYCQLYSLLVQLPSVVPCVDSILRSFLCVKQKLDHRGIRTPNLLIRSHTPYPLGHAAMCPVNCICCLFSCQVLSLVMTRFSRSIFCQAKSRRQRDSKPQSCDSKSDALSVGPCGQMSCQLYLLLVKLPSVVLYTDILCKNFL